MILLQSISIKLNKLSHETLPGLVVMGGDSCSEGRWFESQHHILDGHFFIYICCKICSNVCLKRPERNDKRPELVHFLTIKLNYASSLIPLTQYIDVTLSTFINKQEASL